MLSPGGRSMARRPMAVALLAGLAVLAMVLVAKDLNDKLGVMTASNQEYQVRKLVSPTIRFPLVELKNSLLISGNDRQPSAQDKKAAGTYN